MLNGASVKVGAVTLAALVSVVAFAVIGSPLQPALAAGFGASCLNRHDASIRNVYVFNAIVNYTGNGEDLVVANANSTIAGVSSGVGGYTVDVWLNVNPAIMMNAQADTTNGSIFVKTNVYGTAYRACIYNIGLNQTYYIFEAHVTNMTGYASGQTQSVVWSTGTHSGQYNVTWLGP